MPFKTNNTFNSTMMASFLPVIVSKKNKVKEKYFFYCSDSVSQIHINPLKNTKKHQNDLDSSIGPQSVTRLAMPMP